tara:strand:- start:242 stop:625 length:384 start_codon:yes stop_codon:yes gene_type:complete
MEMHGQILTMIGKHTQMGMQTLSLTTRLNGEILMETALETMPVETTLMIAQEKQVVHGKIDMVVQIWTVMDGQMGGMLCQLTQHNGKTVTEMATVITPMGATLMLSLMMQLNGVIETEMAMETIQLV